MATDIKSPSSSPSPLSSSVPSDSPGLPADQASAPVSPTLVGAVIATAATTVAATATASILPPPPPRRLRSLLTRPMPEPTRAGLVFYAADPDAERYILDGWAEEIDDSEGIMTAADTEESIRAAAAAGKAKSDLEGMATELRVLPGTHTPGSTDPNPDGKSKL